MKCTITVTNRLPESKYRYAHPSPRVNSGMKTSRLAWWRAKMTADRGEASAIGSTDPSQGNIKPLRRRCMEEMIINQSINHSNDVELADEKSFASKVVLRTAH